MFRSSTLVVAAVLGAGSASVAGCERGMLDSRGGGGGAGHPGPLGIGNGGGTGLSGGNTGIGGGMSCAAIDRPVAPAGLDVLVVVAASASMDWDATNNQICSGGCGATSKWAQAITAINTVVSQTQSTVDWGLELVPEDSAGLCTVATEATLPVLVGDAAGIAAALAVRTSANGGLSNGGNNAARAGVEVAASHLSTLTDDNRRVIVLVTDGAPNCAPDDGSADDGALAVQAITQAARWGFPTFVASFAPPSALEVPTLNRMAVAGDTGQSTPLFVASASELATALRTTVADSARCVFTIPPPPNNDGTLTRSSISVAIDGVPVPYDSTHENGWTTPTIRTRTCSSTDRSATASWLRRLPQSPSPSCAFCYEPRNLDIAPGRDAGRRGCLRPGLGLRPPTARQSSAAAAAAAGRPASARAAAVGPSAAPTETSAPR